MRGMRMYDKQKYHYIQQDDKVIGSAIKKWTEEAIANGKLINPFIEQYMEARISCARWALALAMAMTVLVRGGIALWIVFILIYRTEVKRYKKEAWEAQLKELKK